MENLKVKAYDLRQDVIDMILAGKGGNVKKELKLSDRVYLCRCGNRIDRDLNAAINIREEARRMLLAG